MVTMGIMVTMVTFVLHNIVGLAVIHMNSRGLCAAGCTTLHYTRAMSGSVVQCGTLDLDSGGRKEYHSCNLLNKLKSMLAFHSLTWTVPSSQSQLLCPNILVSLKKL